MITPYRPMSLEAAAGKNPVTHVGKIYNVVAREIAEAIFAADPGVAAAQCLMVSRIGSPVTRPAIVNVKLATKDGLPIDRFEPQIEDIVVDRLGGIREIVDGFVAGAISVV